MVKETSNKEGNTSDWLFGQRTDLFGLFLPVWASWLICFLLPAPLLNQSFPLWAWVLVVLAIDVGHVWSTIWRTYLDKEEFRLHQNLLVIAPFASFCVMFLVASFMESWFWRIMAYLALFHFIRQQYGFMMLYKARKKEAPTASFFSDKWVIYGSMLYPVIYWHFQEGSRFHWFAQHDFLPLYHWLPFELNNLWPFGHAVYWALLLAWAAENGLRQKAVSRGKIIWVLTTAANWYIGIVYFNSDIAFTLTNVIAHGIPYLLLMAIYRQRKSALTTAKKRVKKPTLLRISLFLAVALLLAFAEEYCWDMWINRDKQPFFESLWQFPMEALQNPLVKAAAVGLLSVPQVAHYIIDGYIWKNSPKNPYVPLVLFEPPQQETASENQHIRA